MYGLLIEGGFDPNSNFVYLSISNTKRMTELFRHTVIKYFKDNKLINSDFTRNLLSGRTPVFLLIIL